MWTTMWWQGEGNGVETKRESCLTQAHVAGKGRHCGSGARLGWAKVSHLERHRHAWVAHVEMRVYASAQVMTC